MDKKYILDFITKLNHPIDDVRDRAVINIYNKIERGIITVDDLSKFSEYARYLLQIFNQSVVVQPDKVLHLIKLSSETKNGCRSLIKCGGIEFLTQLKLESYGRHITTLIDSILMNLLKLKTLKELDLNSELNEEPIYYLGKSKVLEEQVNQSNNEENQQRFGYFNDISSQEDFSNHMSRVNDSLDVDMDNFFNICVFPTIPLTETDKTVLSGCLGTLKSEDFRVVLSGIQFFMDVIIEDFPAPVFLQRQGALKILLHYLSDNRFANISLRALVKYINKLKRFIYQCLDPNYFTTKNAYLIIKQNCEEDNRDNLHYPYQTGDEMLDLNYQTRLNVPVHLPVPVFALQTISKCLMQLNVLLMDNNNNFAIDCNGTAGLYSGYLQVICVSYRLLLIVVTSEHQQSTNNLSQITCVLLNGGDWWNMKDLMIEQLSLWAKLLNQLSLNNFNMSSSSSSNDTSTFNSSNYRQMYSELFIIFWDLFNKIFTPSLALKLVPVDCQLEIQRALFDRSLAYIVPEFSRIIDYVQLFNQSLSKFYVELSHVLASSEHLMKFFMHCAEPIKYAEICVESANKSLNAIGFIQTNKFAKEFVNLFSIICSTELFGKEDSRQIIQNAEHVIEHLTGSTNLGLVKSTFSEIFELVNTHVTIEQLARTHSSERRITFLLRPVVFHQLIISGLYNEQLAEVRETSSVILCKLWDSKGLLSMQSWLQLVDVTVQHLTWLQPLADTTNRLGRHIIQWSFTERNNSTNNKSLDVLKLLPLFYNCSSFVRHEAATKLEEYLRKDNSQLHKPGNRVMWDSTTVNIRSMSDFLIGCVTDSSQDFARLVEHRWMLQGMWKFVVEVTKPKKSVAPLNIDNKQKSEEMTNFMKVLEIFLGDNIDISVRKSAAEQLAIFLQAGQLHTAFINNGGVHYLLCVITGKHFDKSHTAILMPSCVLMLLRLVQYSILFYAAPSQTHSDPINNRYSTSSVINSLLLDSATDDNVSLPTHLLYIALYFCYDKQMLADISVILALLIWYKSIRLNCDFTSASPISMPEQMQDKIILPFPCTYHQHSTDPANSSNYSLLVQLMDQLDQNNQSMHKPIRNSQKHRDWLNHNIRVHWTLLKHGGLDNYIDYRFSFIGRHYHYLIDSSSTNKNEDNAALVDSIISDQSSLSMTSSDQYLLHSCINQIVVCDRLHKLANATNHHSVFYAISAVHTQLLMMTHLNCSNNDLPQKLVTSIFHNPQQWWGCLRRFLINIPCSTADYQLLQLIIDLLQLIFTLLSTTSHKSCLCKFHNWLTDILILPNNPLIYCLLKSDKIIGRTDSRRLTFAKHQIQMNLPQFFVDYLQFSSHFENDSTTNTTPIHKIIYDKSLSVLIDKCADSTHNPFDQLGVLINWLKLQVCCCARPTNTNSHSQPQQEQHCNLLSLSAQLIDKLQSSQSDSLISFMGCGTLHQLIWIIDFSLVHTDLSNLLKQKTTWWLFQLLGYRDCEIRASALSILNKIITNANHKLLEIIFDQCQQLLPESLWHVLITLFNDYSEAGLVRAQAVACLQSLCIVVPLQNNVELTKLPVNNRLPLELKLQPYFYDESQQRHLFGGNALYKLMKQYDLIRKIALMLTNFLPVKDLRGLFHRERCQLIKSQELNFTTSLILSPIVGLLGNLFYYLPNELSADLLDLRINTIIMNLFDSNFQGDIELVYGFTDCVRFLQLQMQYSSNYRDSFLIDDRFLGLILNIFVKTYNGGAETRGFNQSLNELRVEITRLLINLVLPCPTSSNFELVITHFVSNIMGIYQCIILMLESNCVKSKIAVLQLIHVFFVTSHKYHPKVNVLITALETTAVSTNQNANSAEQVSMLHYIVERLLQLRDTSPTKSKSEKLNQIVEATLKAVIGASDEAKSYLLNVGFLEILAEQLKRLHKQLDCRSIKSKSPATSWKITIKQLIAIVELIQNMLYNHRSSQLAAVSIELHRVLFSLWTAALLNSELMTSLLRCFINLTGLIPYGHLAAESSSSQSDSSCIVGKRLARALTSTHNSDGCCVDSFVKVLLSITSRYDNKDNISQYHTQQHTHLFQILSNMAWSTETIASITRSKFIDQFAKLNPNQLQKLSNGVILQRDWLCLLIGLSWTNDGCQLALLSNQQYCAIIGVLISQLRISSLRNAAMLIIRNIATAASSPNSNHAARIKIIVDGGQLVQLLMDILRDTKDFSLRQLALSTIKSLIFSNNKIRGYLKSTDMLDTLTQLRDYCQEALANQSSGQMGQSLMTMRSDIVQITNTLSYSTYDTTTTTNVATTPASNAIKLK